MPQLDIATLLHAPAAEPPWLVPDVLLQGQMAVMAGEPGVGKSVLAYALALAVALDVPFLGRLVTPGHVLYFDEENSLPDLQEYLRWLWHGLERPLLTHAARLHLFHFSLLGQPHRYPFMAQLANQHQPLLIIIDTATPALDIQDEDKNAEASRAISNLRKVQAAAGPACSVLILKHALLTHEKGARRTVRGAKAWEGATDGLFFHVAAAGRPRKDGLRASHLEPGKVRAFGLRQELYIEPSWVGAGTERGLALSERQNAPKSPETLPKGRLRNIIPGNKGFGPSTRDTNSPDSA